MTEWQYFYTTSGSARPDSPPRSLGRTDRDGPAYNCQTLGAEATWVDSEFLSRYHLLGTNENDYVEITEERAAEIVDAWVASGRLPRRPEEPKASGSS